MPKKELLIKDLVEGDTVVFRKLFKDYDAGEDAEAIDIKKGTKARVMSFSNTKKFIKITTEGKERKISFGAEDVKTYLRLPKPKNTPISAPHDDVEFAVINGDRVIVELKTGFKGISVCDPTNEFNAVIGYDIAYNIAKKKEANYNHRVDKAAYKATIYAAEKMIADIEKKYKSEEKKYDYNIRKAISKVKEKPTSDVPF